MMPLLMKLSRVNKDPLLERFKEKFFKRFEEREVPLLLAMDDEAGPGYKTEDNMTADSDLLNDLRIPAKLGQSRSLSFAPVDICEKLVLF